MDTLEKNPYIPLLQKAIGNKSLEITEDDVLRCDHPLVFFLYLIKSEAFKESGSSEDGMEILDIELPVLIDHFWENVTDLEAVARHGVREKIGNWAGSFLFLLDSITVPRWSIFENLVASFNDREVRIDRMQGSTPEEIVNALLIIEAFKPMKYYHDCLTYIFANFEQFDFPVSLPAVERAIVSGHDNKRKLYSPKLLIPKNWIDYKDVESKYPDSQYQITLNGIREYLELELDKIKNYSLKNNWKMVDSNNLELMASSISN